MLSPADFHGKCASVQARAFLAMKFLSSAIERLSKPVVLITGTPSAAERAGASTNFPSFSSSSLMLRATIIGIFISASCIVRNRFLSKFEESTTFTIRSKSPADMASAAIFSSADEAERVYTPGRSSTSISHPPAEKPPVLRSTVTPA